MVLALWRMLVVCHWCWRNNMRSCSMEELSICICISISLCICICFAFCNMMRIWMRWSKSKCRSMNIMMSNNMRINRTSYHMVHHSTVSLGGNMSVSTMLSNNILALLYIGGVHHSVVLGGALLLLVALLLCMSGTLLLCYLLHHCVALRHCVCSTLLFMFSNIVSNMFCVTHSLWYSMALLGCHHFIGKMTPWSIVTISISTMSTMAIVMTIAWVTFCCGFCFSRAERNIEEAKKNYNLLDHDVV